VPVARGRFVYVLAMFVPARAPIGIRTVVVKLLHQLLRLTLGKLEFRHENH
jgi:hypothetical protein